MSNLKPAVEVVTYQSADSILTKEYRSIRKPNFNKKYTPITEFINHGRHDTKFFYDIDRLLNFVEWCSVKEDYEFTRKVDKLEEFLRDTLSFLKTGKRDMSINMWKQLMPLMKPSGGNNYRSKGFSNMVNMSVPDEHALSFIDMWCSKPDGLHDMIATYLLLNQIEEDNI